MAKKGWAKSCCGVINSILAALALYGALYLAVLIFQKGAIPKYPSDLYKSPAKGHDSSYSDQIGSPGSLPLPPPELQVEKINPNANWFNRPESLVVPNDDYLGKRPDADTIANITRLVEECRGSYAKFERMPYVYDCLKYINEQENDYYYLPSNEDRRSKQSPKKAEYLNADGKDNTLDAYPKYKAASKASIGQCNGPIVPYHTYWTGPATWRVELLTKSYFHTQNIPCSRLWIWLDGDRNPDAIDQMMNHDPLFARFLPLVERGDIVLKLWRFPHKIPLPPGDNTDGVGYYKNPGKPNVNNEVMVADGLMRDATGQEWLILAEKQMTFLPVAVSDAVRFVVLHLYGGAYFDMDIVMLRDMRPLLIGDDHAFAERWAAHPSPGDYNTAVMSLTANSSLSTYLLRGGVRMGLNFHPRVIGVMAVKDHRNQEFAMLETAAFDPIWTEFNWDRLGRCTIPCFKDYSQAFKGKDPFPRKDEWESYDGPQLEPGSAKTKHFWEITRSIDSAEVEERDEVKLERRATTQKKLEQVTFDRAALSKAEYIIEEDNYPPTNRTLENFFRGAWTYHIHNQWAKHPEPSSWLNVIQRVHDGFFSDDRKNPYGENWDGPDLARYELSWEFV